MKVPLLSSTHWLMETDAQRAVVWLRRLPVPFESIAEIAEANAAVVQKFERRFASWGLIVDMRQAPSRNDPAFENAMQGLRAQVELHFKRTAVLLATRVGMLQVNRIAREEGGTNFATTDEAAALRFVCGEPDPT